MPRSSWHQSSYSADSSCSLLSRGFAKGDTIPIAEKCQVEHAASWNKDRFIAGNGEPALLARLFRVLAADLALSMASSWISQWYGLFTCLVSSKAVEGVANITTDALNGSSDSGYWKSSHTHRRHATEMQRRSCRPSSTSDHGRQSCDKVWL
ncbi:unnamed protein product [Cladocopium goreaui]|uniref:Uncharacterized protein n=1 Tax=Cladocopium goreaui TaxID=2562237 RepID=A0A9P1DP60_9DINO|nr:unnamed protein product [Cladocopium goreaui]